MRDVRLVEATAVRGGTDERLAMSVGAGPKTPERWANLGRVPHRATALTVAERLDR
jgi:hypothetical protein